MINMEIGGIRIVIIEGMFRDKRRTPNGIYILYKGQVNLHGHDMICINVCIFLVFIPFKYGWIYLVGPLKLLN